MVDFSNKWFRQTCIDNDLNPDNELSKSAVDLARDCAIEVKKYMMAKENYAHTNDENLMDKFDERINALNNKRIEHMLNALFYAEVMQGLGDDFNKFVKVQMQRKQHLLRGS